MPEIHPEEAEPEHTNRRRFLKTVGALSAIGLAGCGGDGDSTETESTDTETESTDTETDSDDMGTPAETDGDGMGTLTATGNKDTETETPTQTPTTGGIGTPAVEMPSLEAYYSLDEASLPPTNTVTGTDAAVTGEPTTGEPGIRNTAFGFTTDDSRKTTGDALTSGRELPLNGQAATVATWFRYTSKESYARVYQVGGGGPDGIPSVAGGGHNVEFIAGSNDIALALWPPEGGSSNKAGPVTLSPETWYFLVCVVDGNEGRMYVFDQDGELTDGGVTTSGRGQTGSELLNLMGGDSSDPAGRMDEVYAFSKALSASEVMTLYDNSF